MIEVFSSSEGKIKSDKMNDLLSKRSPEGGIDPQSFRAIEDAIAIGESVRKTHRLV